MPIAFILSIVSLFLKGKKGFGIAGLVISIVGTIVGTMVFLFGMANAVDEVLSGGEVTASLPDGSTASDTDQGTRANPYPLGASVTQGDWTVTVNSVTLNATDEVMSANMFNDAPAEGNEYLVVNYTATYQGTNPQGEMPMTTISYVTADGQTLDNFGFIATVDNAFDSLSTLYEGASTTGNEALQAPTATAAEGTLAVRITPFGDTQFFAVQ